MPEQSEETQGQLSQREFITLVALLMSLVALSIDAVLPALPTIGHDLRAGTANDVQLVVAMVFLGLAFGQLVYGPLSDSVGRKPTLATGIAIFLIGTVIVVTASDFDWMLAGRFIEGFGLAAARIVAIALVRDIYVGRDMAQIMSFIMTLFILVPMVAPLLGQAVLLIAGWRTIFFVVMAVGIASLTWFLLRQPETLMPSKRRSLSIGPILSAFAEVLRTRRSMGYSMVAAISSGVFIAYLSSIQQVLGQQYGFGNWFAVVFTCLSVSLGLASFLSGRIVHRIGMHRIILSGLMIVCVASGCFTVLSVLTDGHPHLWWLLLYLAVLMFCSGLFFGNTNAAAMEPLGHLAGTAASVIGFVTSVISVPVGMVIARAYDGTTTPLAIGFLTCNLVSLAIVWWMELNKAEG